MRVSTGTMLGRALILIPVAAGMLWAAGAAADTVTFSGSVSYTGNYSGDSLYVAVLDTANAGEDVNILVLQAFDPGPPPFNQLFSLQFDNTGVGSQVMVASLLDVDGDGTNSVTGADVFGWYNGGTLPTGISSASSQSGLDFSLPRGEIRGILTFTAGQTEARVSVTPDLTCMTEGFRPNDPFQADGSYAMVGIYPGTYCVYASGNTSTGYAQICYGDPSCASPTTITLADGEVKNNVDFDFTDTAPVEPTTWGLLKSRY